MDLRLVPRGWAHLQAHSLPVARASPSLRVGHITGTSLALRRTAQGLSPERRILEPALGEKRPRPARSAPRPGHPLGDPGLHGTPVRFTLARAVAWLPHLGLERPNCLNRLELRCVNGRSRLRARGRVFGQKLPSATGSSGDFLTDCPSGRGANGDHTPPLNVNFCQPQPILAGPGRWGRRVGHSEFAQGVGVLTGLVDEVCEFAVFEVAGLASRLGMRARPPGCPPVGWVRSWVRLDPEPPPLRGVRPGGPRPNFLT